jgi:hypothetical protein
MFFYYLGVSAMDDSLYSDRGRRLPGNRFRCRPCCVLFELRCSWIVKVSDKRDRRRREKTRLLKKSKSRWRIINWRSRESAGEKKGRTGSSYHAANSTDLIKTFFFPLAGLLKTTSRHATRQRMETDCVGSCRTRAREKSACVGDLH